MCRMNSKSNKRKRTPVSWQLRGRNKTRKVVSPTETVYLLTWALRIGTREVGKLCSEDTRSDVPVSCTRGDRRRTYAELRAGPDHKASTRTPNAAAVFGFVTASYKEPLDVVCLSPLLP